MSALTPRVDDESGAADVAMIAMQFDGGPVARLDVSLVEPWPRQETVIGCDGRTIVINALDATAPLQIHASAKHRGPQRSGQWAETVSEHPLTPTGDRYAETAALFVDAVRKRSAAGTNARDLARATLVWETARASMSGAGEMLALPADGALVERRRPVLQVIEGGGHTFDAEHAPALTVVGR